MKKIKIIIIKARRWWRTPLIPALGRQVNFCEFEASLIYKSEFQDRLQSYRETLSPKIKKNCCGCGIYFTAIKP